MLKLLHHALSVSAILIFAPSAVAFTPSHQKIHVAKISYERSALFYKRHPTEVETGYIQGTGSSYTQSKNKQRDELKKKLAKTAITHYDAEEGGKSMHAEEIMKELEKIKPWDRPVYDERLNARWSFVFTGVPTIGMKLITLLSRISFGFPIVDFRDVYLEVTDEQSMVKAVVAVKVFGVPVELNVRTALAPDESDPDGVMMLESFEELIIGGKLTINCT
eukprot:13356852-Ditylum_brightwellii.AAC.1